MTTGYCASVGQQTSDFRTSSPPTTPIPLKNTRSTIPFPKVSFQILNMSVTFQYLSVCSFLINLIFILRLHAFCSFTIIYKSPVCLGKNSRLFLIFVVGWLQEGEKEEVSGFSKCQNEKKLVFLTFEEFQSFL